MKTRVVVVSYINNKGKVLFGKKSPNRGPYPNTWHLPGGGVEEDETLIDALKREVKEETGLTVKDAKQIFFNDDKALNKHGEMTHYIFLVFNVSVEDVNFKPGDDLVELKWFEEKKIKDIPVTKPSRDFFKYIGLL